MKTYLFFLYCLLQVKINFISITKPFILNFYFLKSLNANEIRLELDSKQFEKDAFVALFNCTQQTSINSAYFNLDSSQWLAQSTCLSTDMDILSYCQRAYPKQNVINILELPNAVWRFKLKESQILTTQKIYKCLYGSYKSTQQLYIPTNCLFQHMFSQNECKSNRVWNLMAQEKCKSLTNYELNSSVLLQWCDAFKGGVSTFNGVEFVCCPLKPKSILTKSLNQISINDKQEMLNEDDDIDDEPEKTIFLPNSNIEIKNLNDSIKESVIDQQVQHGYLGYAGFFFVIGFLLTILVFFACYIYLNRIKFKSRKMNSNNMNQHLINGNVEDSHLNNMQINGYENPTYKFFEQNKPIV